MSEQLPVPGDPIPSGPGNTQAVEDQSAPSLTGGPQRLPPSKPATVVTPPGGTGDEVEVTFQSEDDFREAMLQEDPRAPACVLGFSAVATFVAAAFRGYSFTGVSGLISAVAVSVALLGIAISLGAFGGWVVSKLFDEDYGSIQTLILRCGAVTAIIFPAFELLSLILPVTPAFFCCGPLMFVTAMWLLRVGIAPALTLTVSLLGVMYVLLMFLDLMTVSSFA